ncbi:fibronectin type III domain-containing protein [Bacillus paranthracis]
MMIMCLSVLPSFASAEYETENILLDETNISYIPALLDGKDSTYNVIKGQYGFPFSFKRKIIDIKSINIKTVDEKDLNSIVIGVGNDGSVINRVSYNSVKKDINVLKKLLPFSYLQIINNSYSEVKVAEAEIIGSFEGAMNIADITNLSSTESVNHVGFTWVNPSDSKFTGVSIYKDNEFLKTVDKSVSSYKVEGLEANKNYTFKFVALYGDKKSSGVQKGVKTLIDPKTIPPGQVSSLTAEPTYQTVKLKWKRPKDDDLAGFKILQNGKQIAEIGLEEEFTVKNLKQLTDYTFSVISVDKDKNDSPPVSLSVKTLEEKDDVPPQVPLNVDVKPSNGALIASWDKVSDEDLAGYNVYVDGKKINNNLITSTTFVIKNLENGKKYKIQVQAVDRSKNSSELSLAAFGTPDVNTMPFVENDYSVKHVSDGVGTMFSGLWLALAFAVSIPLAFYVIYKLKQTILS